MIKRLFVIIIVYACFFPATFTVVYADVVLTDSRAELENDFFSKYSSQIIYLGRSFVANSETGSVGVKTEPESKKDIAGIENGEVVFVQYSCLYGGGFWGFTFDYSGWIKLDQMLVLYDYVAFAEEHQEEFYSYTGDYNEIEEARSVVVWPWPGADAPLWTLEDLDMKSFLVFHAFKDEEGREWGFIQYLFINRNIWVCLSDPNSRDLPVFNPAPPPYVWVSETDHVDIKQYLKEKELPVLIAAIILVAAVVAGTAVLIRKFWKPKRV